jgi:hypothetical protein
LYRVGVTFSAAKLAREGVVIATAAAATAKSKTTVQSIGVFASRNLAAGAALPAADAATTQQHRHRFRQFLFAGKCPQPVHFEVQGPFDRMIEIVKIRNQKEEQISFLKNIIDDYFGL